MKAACVKWSDYSLAICQIDAVQQGKKCEKMIYIQFTTLEVVMSNIAADYK